jgi:hypothetical protein
MKSNNGLKPQEKFMNSVTLEHPAQTVLTFVTESYDLPPVIQSFRNIIINYVAPSLPNFVICEKKQVSLGRHPLQKLHHLIQRTLQGESSDGLQEALYTVPERLRSALFFEVWSQASDPCKNSERWGEDHALDNFPRLLNVIKSVVESRLDTLPKEKQSEVFGTVYQIAGQPQTHDLYWGEHNAKSDTQRLIRALHRRQCLDIPGKEINVYSDLEKNLSVPSRAFHLNVRELPQGQIGLYNGMLTSFEEAYASAHKLSHECAQEYNLHCIYSATVNVQWDTASAFLGQAGITTPPFLHLLEQWQDFFEKNDQSRLLQICHSRGAIEVSNGLSYLSAEQKQKIIVIAVGPAHLFEPTQAYKVVNLVIRTDPILQLAAGQDQLEREHTQILQNHNDTTNPHDLHGSSFREKLSTLIDSYIRTNDI